MARRWPRARELVPAAARASADALIAALLEARAEPGPARAPRACATCSRR